MKPKTPIHLEILQSVLDEAEEKPNHWKKPFFILIGVLLIVLVFTYLTPELLPYLQGRLATDEIQNDYTIELKNGERIVFNAAVYEQLQVLYRTTQTHEFKTCLKGEKIGENYMVHSLQMPIVYSESVYHVTSELCDAGTIIDLHSHPPEHCVISEQDEKSQAYFKTINPHSIGAVMCSETRFGFYG